MMSLNIRAMVLSGISIPAGRNFDQNTVDNLKTSMAKVGLLNPITVQREGAQLLPFWLIAGRNRLEAARQLGWTHVNAVELPYGSVGNDLAKRVEIAENLHRREITALERNGLQARWTELMSKVNHEVSRELRGKLKGGRPEGGIEKAAREIGIPATNLRQSLKIAALSPEAKEAARATGLDNNQSALLAAAKHKEPERQVEALQQRTSMPIKSVPSEPTDFSRMRDAWTATSVTGQTAFLEWITILDAWTTTSAAGRAAFLEWVEVNHPNGADHV